MAYEPTVWETGDVITAEKLNKAEQGIAGAYPLSVIISTDVSTGELVMDKTYKQIHDAYLAGIPVVMRREDIDSDVERVVFLSGFAEGKGGTLDVRTQEYSGTNATAVEYVYTVATETDYPVYSDVPPVG